MIWWARHGIKWDVTVRLRSRAIGHRLHSSGTVTLSIKLGLLRRSSGVRIAVERGNWGQYIALIWIHDLDAVTITRQGCLAGVGQPSARDFQLIRCGTLSYLTSFTLSVKVRKTRNYYYRMRKYT